MNVRLVLGEKAPFSRNSMGEIGEAQGVVAGEGLGDRVPISMARASVHAKPQLERYSSVSMSTTRSRVR